MTNNLITSLAAFEEQYHRVKFRAGMAPTIMVAVTVLLAGCAIDYHLALPYKGRLALSLLCYGVTAAFAIFGWLLPSLMPVSAGKLAWMIERIHPEFNEKLISAVEFQNTPDKHVSMDLLKTVLEETEIDLERIKAGQAMPLTWKHFALPGFMLVLFITTLLLPEARMPTLVKRVALPSVKDASAGAFRLRFKAPVTDTFIEDRSVRFDVASTDHTVNDVELVLEGPRNRRLPMKWDRERGVLVAEIDDLYGNFDYRAVSGQVATRLHSLKMIKLPRVYRFIKTYSFPDYTQLKPVSITAGNGNLKALEGARADMTVEVTKPLSSAWVQYNEENILARIAENGKSLTFSLTIAAPNNYTLNLMDKGREDAVTELTCKVESIPDKMPSVHILRPKENLLVEQNEKIQIEWKPEDDYGVVKQTAVAQLDNQKLKEIALTPATTNLMLDLNGFDLFPGDVLELKIAAEDATEQIGRSHPLRLTLVQGVDLQKSLAYLKAGQQAAKHIRFGRAEFTEMMNLRDAIRDALVYKSGRALENLDHNRSMLTARREKLARHLDRSASACSNMGRSAFFPKADSYSFLTADYLESGTLYLIPELSGSKTDSPAWNGAQKMLDLSSAMTTGLVTIAENQIPYLSAKLLNQIARHACFQDDNQSRQWTRRLHKRALELAQKHAPSFTNGLSRVKLAAKKKPLNPGLKPGLEGRIYPDKTKYPEDWENRTPEKGVKQRIDKSMTFASAKDMSMASDTQFAARWQGYVRVDEPGVYEFHLESDGRSRLYVNGTRAGTIELSRGYHDISIVYKNKDNDAALYATWNRKNQPAHELNSAHVFADLGTGEAQLLYLVRNLTEHLAESACDSSELDKIAARMREAMQQTTENLEKLAARLETTNKEDDWQQLKRMEQALKKASENAETLDARHDKKMAAETLREASRDRDPDKVRDTVEALQVIDEWHRGERSSKSLRDTLKEASRQLQEAETKLRFDENTTERQAAARDLENLTAKLEQAKQLAFAEKQAHMRKASEDILKQLKDAQKKAKKAAQETVSGAEPSDRDIDGIQRQLKDAEKLTVPDRDRKEQYRYARQKLESMESPLDQKIARAQEDIRNTASKIKPEANSADALAELRRGRDRLTEASRDLDAVAKELAKKAEIRLLGNLGKAEDARAAMALSAALKTTGRDIESARDKMVDSVRPPSDPDQTDRGREMRRESEASLKKAAAELKEIEKTFRDWQASERDELSAQEESELKNSLDRLSRDNLPGELQTQLNKLALMEESSDELKDLSEKTRKLGSSPPENRREELRKETEKTGRKLTGLLAAGDKDEALETARQLVNQAKKDVADLLPAYDNLEKLNKALREAESFGEKPRRAAAENHLPLKAEAMKTIDDIAAGADSDKQDKIDSIRETFPGAPASKQPEMLRNMAKHLSDEKDDQKKRIEKLAKEMEDNAEKTGWEDNWQKRRNKSLDNARRAAEQVDRKLAEAGLEDNANPRKLARAVKNKAAARELASAQKSAEALNKSFDQAASKQPGAAASKQPTPDTPRTPSSSPETERQAPTTSPLKPTLAKAAKELQGAAQHPGRHQKPLAAALEKTGKRQLPQAARLASQTSYAKAAMPELEKGANAMDNAWKKLGDAVARPAENGKRNDKQWEQIASHMESGNLSDAAEEARKTGSKGAQLRNALQQAEKAAQSAEEKLKEAAETAQINPHKSRAGDLLNQASEYLATDTGEMPESAGEIGQKLSQAGDALEKNQFQQAAQAVASAMQTVPGPQHPVPSIQSPAPSIQQPAPSIQHPESSIQHPASSIQQPALASAAAQTQEAARELGSPSPQTDRASQAMDSARQQLQQAQQSTAGQIAAQSEMADSSRQNRQTSTGSGEGGSGATAKHRGAIITEMIGDGWEGTDGKLRSRDLTDRASGYSPYYRNAMKQYMKRIAKERAARKPITQNETTGELN